MPLAHKAPERPQRAPPFGRLPHKRLAREVASHVSAWSARAVQWAQKKKDRKRETEKSAGRGRLGSRIRDNLSLSVQRRALFSLESIRPRVLQRQYARAVLMFHGRGYR